MAGNGWTLDGSERLLDNGNHNTRRRRGLSAGGLTQAVFIALSLGSVWLFLRTLNRRLFSVFPKHGDLPLNHIPKRLWRVL